MILRVLFLFSNYFLCNASKCHYILIVFENLQNNNTSLYSGCIVLCIHVLNSYLSWEKPRNFPPSTHLMCHCANPEFFTWTSNIQVPRRRRRGRRKAHFLRRRLQILTFIHLALQQTESLADFPVWHNEVREGDYSVTSVPDSWVPTGG